MIGKKTWVFPDAERPAQTEEGSLDAHESLLVLNPNSDEVLLNIRFWYENRDPKEVSVTVGANRVRNFRITDNSDFKEAVPGNGIQYAIGVFSSMPIVCQYGRLDTTQSNMAFLSCIGYSE